MHVLHNFVRGGIPCAVEGHMKSSNQHCFPQSLFILLSQNLDFANSSKLADQEAPEILLSLHTQHYIIGTYSHTQMSVSQVIMLTRQSVYHMRCPSSPNYPISLQVCSHTGNSDRSLNAVSSHRENSPAR